MPPEAVPEAKPPLGPKGWLGRATHFLHAHLFLLLIAAYVLAAVVPAAGVWINQLEVVLYAEAGVRIRGTILLLASLLFVAGLGMLPTDERYLRRRWDLLGAGLIIRSIVPMLVVLILAAVSDRLSADYQAVIVGLAIAAALPAAGSSTAWAQHTGGQLALCLGLVIGSTLLAPVVLPLLLQLPLALLAEQPQLWLQQISYRQATPLLVGAVLLPTAIGIAINRSLGPVRVAGMRPHLKTLNCVLLLVLNYANAATALPALAAAPNLALLLMVLVSTGLLCGSAFVAAAVAAQRLGANDPERAALLFGVGMNNNGIGLTMTAAALPQHPAILLPLIAANLVQHLAAALVARGAHAAVVEEVAEPLE